MSSDAAGALVGAAGCLLVSPYLARLTLTVPDGDATRWWLGVPAASRRLAATAGTALVLGALAGRAAGWSALLPAFLALAVVATPLIVIDYEHHRLPNRLVFVGVGLEVALLLFAAAERDAWSDGLRAAEGAVAVFLAFFLLRFISPRSFGYGDVKLGGVLGGYLGWFGWIHVYYGIFAGFVLGALLSLGLLASRRATMKSAIPFGPMLVVGALVVLAFDLVPAT
jgi:leader peptidase (prepilin peptidase) / N-methyltransferase